MKKTVKFKMVPENEKWRISLIKELTNVKHNKLEIRFEDGEIISDNDIENILSFASTT